MAVALPLLALVDENAAGTKRTMSAGFPINRASATWLMPTHLSSTPTSKATLRLRLYLRLRLPLELQRARASALHHPLQRAGAIKTRSWCH